MVIDETVIPIRPEINQQADASGACTVTFQHCRYGCHLLRSPTFNLDFYTHPVLSLDHLFPRTLDMMLTQRESMIDSSGGRVTL